MYKNTSFAFEPDMTPQEVRQSQRVAIYMHLMSGEYINRAICLEVFGGIELAPRLKEIEKLHHCEIKRWWWPGEPFKRYALAEFAERWGYEPAREHHKDPAEVAKERERLAARSLRRRKSKGNKSQSM